MADGNGNGNGDIHYPTLGFMFYFLYWNILHVSSPSLACTSETQKSTKTSLFCLFLSWSQAHLIAKPDLNWQENMCGLSFSHCMRMLTSFSEEMSTCFCPVSDRDGIYYMTYMHCLTFLKFNSSEF